jgi:GT2 family glycosyltransferase
MKISYILPVTSDTGVRCTNTSIAMKYLARTFDSILSQSIPYWELIVVVEKALEQKVSTILNKAIQSTSLIKEFNNDKLKSSICLITTTSTNAAIACNKGLGLCKGQYVALIQAGDQLADVTTYELIKCLVENPKAQFIYTDHDHLDLQGIRFKPFFKPDLSPDLLYCQNYISNIVLVKKSLLKRLGGWNSQFSAAYDYALSLNAISTLTKLDRPNRKLLGDQSPIKHIAKILYHQRTNLKVNPKSKQLLEIRSSKLDETKHSHQGLTLLKRFFHFQKRNVTVKQIKPKLYRHQWAIPKPEPLVSLIIPTRDGYDILKTCVQSILKKTTYKNYEILIVDNHSTDLRVLEYMKSLERVHLNVRILKYNKLFNYSAINNYAATKANGSVLGLINNDTEIITPEWLTEMVSHALRPEIGCVGAMLFYPDGSIQHAGVVVGMHGVADHAFKGLKNIHQNDYFHYLTSIRNPKAVTAAALIIKRNLFDKVGGLDEINLKVAFNDVDICLKALIRGIHNLWTPYSQLVHHESKTRKLNLDSEMLEANFLKFTHTIKHIPIHDSFN